MLGNARMRHLCTTALASCTAISHNEMNDVTRTRMLTPFTKRMLAALALILGMGLLVVAVIVITSDTTPAQPPSPIHTAPPQQLPTLPPGAVFRSATWPGYPPDRAFVRSLPEQVQSAIRKSPLPVLLPSSPALAGRAVMIMRPTGYAATIDKYYPNIQVSVSGEAISYGGDHQARIGAERVRGLPATLVRGEIGWFLSWEEFGVSYEVFLGCSYQESIYCKSEYVLEIANSLVYAGGRGVSE